MRPNVALTEGKSGDRDRKPEAARSRATRIQIQNAIPSLNSGLMRMAAHDDVEARGFRVDSKILDVVDDVDAEAGDVERPEAGERARQVSPVVVTPYRDDGRDPLERLENVGLADISGV